MARTCSVRLAVLFAVVLYSVLASANLDSTSNKSKRQIFREQVNPQAGGRIPEDAFRSDRLALNRLNKEGIAVPDGVVLEARHRESHYGSHRHDPDIQASIVKVVLGEDGRYAPPEGRYPFNSLVESTYVLRPPINTPVIAVPPRRPHLSTLRLPARPFFHQGSQADSIDQQIDLFNSFDPSLGLWTGLLGPVPDVPNRLLRRQAKIPIGEPAQQYQGKHNGDSSEYYDQPTSGRPHYAARSLHVVRHPHTYNLHPTYATYIGNPEKDDNEHDDYYKNGLVPVYLTPHENPSKSSNYISYVPPSSKFNFHHILPIVKVSTNPNHHYSSESEETTSDLPNHSVKSHPHHVLDSLVKDKYSSKDKKHHSKDAIHHLKPSEDNYHSFHPSQHSSSTPFEDQKRQPETSKYEEPHQQHPDYAALEESFPKLPSTNNQNEQENHHEKEFVPLLPLTHNPPSSQEYNFIKSEPQRIEDNNNVPHQNPNYQQINSFVSEHSNFQKHEQIEQNFEKVIHYSEQNTDGDQNVKEIDTEEKPPPISNDNFGFQNFNGQTTRYEQYHHIPPVQEDKRWHKQENSLKIVDQDNGVQYIKGGIKFEVVKNRESVEQQSRGEIGQKIHNQAFNQPETLRHFQNPQEVPQQVHNQALNQHDGLQKAHNQDFNHQGPHQKFHNQAFNQQVAPSDVGSKHLDQVLHFIEPHEKIQKISTAPSIENEFPSLNTVPETSFKCQGPGRTMVPDPETSCQVFHLCGADGSKESFLCPKGARYDSQKQQCAPWTQVSCHA